MARQKVAHRITNQAVWIQLTYWLPNWVSIYSFDLFCLLLAGFRPNISILLQRFIDLQTLLVLFLFLYLTNQQKALLKGFCCFSVPLLNVWCHLGIWLVNIYVWYYFLTWTKTKHVVVNVRACNLISIWKNYLYSLFIYVKLIKY